jgi:hypothetical protein
MCGAHATRMAMRNPASARRNSPRPPHTVHRTLAAKHRSAASIPPDLRKPLTEPSPPHATARRRLSHRAFAPIPYRAPSHPSPMQPRPGRLTPAQDAVLGHRAPPTPSSIPIPTPTRARRRLGCRAFAPIPDAAPPGATDSSPGRSPGTSRPTHPIFPSHPNSHPRAAPRGRFRRLRVESNQRCSAGIRRVATYHPRRDNPVSRVLKTNGEPAYLTMRMDLSLGRALAR